jgi:hypothetical protein
VPEKEVHALNYPFKTIPAMKMAKLAVSEFARKDYKGIGTDMRNRCYSLISAFMLFSL